jgi:hypothetical protein
VDWLARSQELTYQPCCPRDRYELPFRFASRASACSSAGGEYFDAHQNAEAPSRSADCVDGKRQQIEQL